MKAIGQKRASQKFTAIAASNYKPLNPDRHLNRRDIFRQNRAAALA
jgi:hypothetical protein